ncbi:DUF4232 domain-containing protein [Streptomyces caatingaensis]|uniref:DUF4232 domain-containing protein n=1 Tax=Streptomyces caatingaensis TaxID=1678637 RepID=UPI0006728208|nr:DUF4232 domain-containing protein [Streptomyces caatingaensis]
MTARPHLPAALAVLTAVAALSLTGCGGGGSSDSSDAKSSASSASSSSEAPDIGAEGEDSAASGAAKGDACAPSDVRLQARPAPSGRVLLVATASKACTAYGFPFLRFDKDQATADMVAASKPASPVRLAPGKSAYAGVVPTSKDGGTPREATELSVSFQAKNGDPVEGGETRAALPGGKLKIDDGVRTTYWVADEASALKG